MPEVNKVQLQFDSQRGRMAQTELALRKEKARLERLEARVNSAIKGLSRQERIKRLSIFENEKAKINSQIADLSKELNDLKQGIKDLSNKSLLRLDPLKAVEELSDQYPILMFPLRLETRFKKIGNQHQLWLRVYPDDCNINKKELLLTEQELENAKSFWIEMWKADGNEDTERGAWRSLVNSHGPGRAAWILKQFKLINKPPKNYEANYAVLVIISDLNLTEAEENALAKYWISFWLAKGDPNIQQVSFDEFKSDLDVNDSVANELIEKTTPENLYDEVPIDIGLDQVIVARLDSPPTQNIWNRAPKAVAMPDKFVAIAYSGDNKKTFPFKRPVKEDLPVGPDPSLAKDQQIYKDDNNDIILNEELRWMVDFDKAVEAGMATKIDLDNQEANSGFDKLFVLGVRFSSNEKSGAELLEKLIQDHYESDEGFGLIKQGTPTNNTEDEPSGYSWLDNADESYDRIFKGSEEFDEQSDYSQQTDGQKLAECLGIDAKIIKNTPNANGRDQLEAYAINSALFPATIGYFMEEMMDPLFSDRDIEATKVFFTNFVSGRGPLPAIRVGRQPYGILPISVYSQLNFDHHVALLGVSGLGDAKYPYLSKLYNLIKNMDAAWDKLTHQVSYIGKEGDSHQILLDVLGLHANSIEFHQRFAQSLMQIYNQLNLQLGPTVAEIVANAIASRGKVILKEFGLNADELKLPILEKYFLSEPNLLNGPMVDDVPDSEINPIRAYTPGDENNPQGMNYIQWLASSDGNSIRLQNFGGNPAPRALLYILLRHSLMLLQAQTGTNLLIANKLINHKTEFFDQDFIHVQKEDSGRSKFDHLYNVFPTITGSDDLLLIQHIYNPNILNEHPEARDLKQTLEALKILEKTPTASLERLLVEHLDSCSYRIDAWKTGLVQYKLLEQRYLNKQEESPRGIYLGAYGWLLEVKPKNSSPSIKQLSSELNSVFNPDGQKYIYIDETNLGYIHAPSIDQAATSAILRNAYDSHKGNGNTNPFAINLTSERIRIANNFLEGVRNGQSLSALLGYQFERGLHDRYELGHTEADKFIYPLRKAFPLVAQKLKDTATTTIDMNDAMDSNNLSDDSKAIETVEANNVIDGLKLIQHVMDSSIKTYPFGLSAEFKLPSASADQSKAITHEVNRLIDIHDALADIVMSEQVYQVVKGNFDRAAGVAEAFSKGSYPPEMEVINTPRSGIALTHRMSIHFDAEASPNTSPNTLFMTPRAKAEPSINEWLSKILPDPSKVECKVVYSTPVEQDNVFVSQKDLGLQPIDLLYASNLDSEQGMMELDDRIMNFVRYSITHHPNTQISIKYTEPIDDLDKTRVSFFELGSTIQSLRKVLIGNRFLTPDSFGLPTGEQSNTGSFDTSHLSVRVSDLQSYLEGIRSTLKTGLDNIVSIAALKSKLDEKLNPHITDPLVKEPIINKIEEDLKSYCLDSSSENKIKIITKFEEKIPDALDNAIKDSLKTDYESYLDQYKTDYPKLDNQIEETSRLFMQAALCDNIQTGTGFIHQGITAIFNSVFEKLEVVIDRWEKKKSDYDFLMVPYASASDDEKFEILQKAERIISPQSTFPLPDSLTEYEDDVTKIKEAFDALFVNIKALRTNGNNKVIGFIDDVETVISDIVKYDVLAFDIENSRNNLHGEKLQLLRLKEDLAIALQNEVKYLSVKIDKCQIYLDEAQGVVSNHEKLVILINAAKCILCEEMLLLPRIILPNPKLTEVENVYHASENILNFVKSKENRIFPVEDWFTGVARVREKVHYFENIANLVPGFKPGSFIDLTPLQFPFQENDRWLAMKFKDEADVSDTFDIKGDKLLYTAHFSREFDKSKPICGIVLDEWTEIIPAKEETTGITFHFDQPSSEPPQIMLLLVPPVIKGKWDWGTIIQSLEETLEMAKKRAIEPSMIEKTKFAQFLPTTLMAVTSYLITVATNLALNNVSVMENE